MCFGYRMAVVFRDPRNVVISERRMRTGDNYSLFANVQYLNDFIHKRFQVRTGSEEVTSCAIEGS